MATIETSLKFGSYDWICSQAALVVCPLVGSSTSGGYGIAPTCYARNVEFGRTLVFQPGEHIDVRGKFPLDRSSRSSGCDQLPHSCTSVL